MNGLANEKSIFTLSYQVKLSLPFLTHTTHTHTRTQHTCSLKLASVFMSNADFPKLKERWNYLAFVWIQGVSIKSTASPKCYSTWSSSSRIHSRAMSLRQNDWYWLPLEFVQFLQSWTFLGTPLYRRHQMIFLFWTHDTCQWKQGSACGPVKCESQQVLGRHTTQVQSPTVTPHPPGPHSGSKATFQK